MRRLSGMDANFLYNERPTQHMHTLKLVIVDPGGEYSFEAEKAAMEARLHTVPPFRWRLAATPLGLHHPLWIEDPEFDLDRHFRRADLPGPGGREALARFVSEVASRPLDRSRPLWEIWMVEGVAGGRVACVMKVHHALADGVATANMLTSFCSTAPGADPTPEEAPWRPEEFPSYARRLAWALRDLAPYLMRGLPALVRALRQARSRRAAHAHLPRGGQMYEGPDTVVNGILGPDRSFAYTSLDLEDVKRAKGSIGATINDIVLAMVSEALRKLLEREQELPGLPLICAVPVSVRRPEDGQWGNRISSMLVRLPTHLADPRERIGFLQAEVTASKRDFDDGRDAHIMDVLELVPPPLVRLLISRIPTWSKRLGRPSQGNIICSNVRGPEDPLYSGHSALEAFFSIGPLSEGIGLNITAWSYHGQLNVALLADRKMIPDLWPVAEGLGEALAELGEL